VQRGRYQEDLRNILIRADNVHRQFATLGKRISHLILRNIVGFAVRPGARLLLGASPSSLEVPQHGLLWRRHAKAGSRLDGKVLRGFGLRFRSLGSGLV
jgi:hypothetical protein